MNDHGDSRERIPEGPDRRGFLGRAASWAMGGSLIASYGTCGLMAGRYLFPARPRAVHWQFVAVVDELAEGAGLAWRSPTGESIAIARRGSTGTVADFVALSSTCPHLGCQVHWEAHNARFFCPCHNGVFDPEGTPLSGPPADAGQSLPQYPLRVDEGLLYIQVPIESLARGSDDGAGSAERPA
jgi:nitrite reductase/ring-hydroxylating ferredoxin subunit